MRTINKGKITGDYNQTLRQSQIIGDARVVDFESVAQRPSRTTREYITVDVEVRDDLEIMAEFTPGSIRPKDVVDAHKVLTNFSIENGFVRDTKKDGDFNAETNGEWESYFWKDDDLTLSVEGKNLWPSDIISSAEELADNLTV